MLTFMLMMKVISRTAQLPTNTLSNASAVVHAGGRFFIRPWKATHPCCQERLDPIPEAVSNTFEIRAGHLLVAGFSFGDRDHEQD
jgi:hypothetical protein